MTGVLLAGAVRRCWRLPLTLVALALVLAACNPHLQLYPRLDSLSRQGKYEQAAKLVEQNKKNYSERNAVLYNLDRGVFYHYAGLYKKSNNALEAAEQRMDDLFTESIARQAGAFLSNDNTLPYRGEDFETVIINIYRALNYLKLGDKEAALVEARKVNEKLKFINSKYEPDERNEYKEDAFARMLAGMLYELGATSSDLNDAFISNRNALKIYESDFLQYGVSAPSALKSNLLTTASFMGRNELGQARKKYPGEKLIPVREKQKLGQLVFVHFAGRSPKKVESSINAPMPDGYLLRIAFPVYRRRNYLVHGSKILIDGKVAVRLENAEPIGRIAIKNLDNRKLRIRGKAIARATTKYLATKVAARAARKRGGAMAGLLTQFAGNVAAVASEQADLRAWVTLPDKILIGRALVSPGRHKVSAQFTTSSGAVTFTKPLGTVEVKAGQAAFFVLHTIN